jgi:hypothetical protein
MKKAHLSKRALPKALVKILTVFFFLYLAAFLWMNLTSDDIYCRGSYCYFPTLWDENRDTSSFIDLSGYSWWRKKLVIVINEERYDYCGVSTSVWKSYEEADSKGSFYNREIKGNFYCY